MASGLVLDNPSFTHLDHTGKGNQDYSPDSSDTASDLNIYKSSTSKRTTWILFGVFLLSCVMIAAIVTPLALQFYNPEETTTVELTLPTLPGTLPTLPGTLPTLPTLPPGPTLPTLPPGPTLPTLPTQPPPTPPEEYKERELTAETDSGPVVGHVVVVNYNAAGTNHEQDVPPAGVVSWYGIPFAKPPVGDLRWKKPLPVEPWTEPLVANKQTPLCIQGGSNVRITHPHWPNEMFQEDCLYLHIQAPRNAAHDPYPVMFWIYGGSFNSGGNVQYPGHFLAMHDVVYIAINYRVNVIGFASTESGEARGNFGLWDQLEALKWVHSNVQAFGGDPNKITIFGESAGAASVGLLVASPEARGYFSQAILQSGNEYSAWAVNGEEVDPHSYIVQVAERWSCTPDTSGGTVTNDDEMMDCLRKVDADDLRRTSFDCHFCLGFSPVVDGEGGMLPKMPLDLRLERLSSEVPIMHGTNSDECTIGLLAEDATLVWRGVNRSEFNWVIDETMNFFEWGITEEDRKGHVRRAFDMWYTPWPFKDNGLENKIALSNMCLDLGFVASNVDQLRHHSRYAKSYKYVYSYQLSPTFPPIDWLPDWIGVPHAFELPLVFGFPHLANNPDVAADAGDLSLDVGVPIIFSPLDRAWSTYTMTLWTNFAKYGNPTPEPVAPPNLAPVVWEEFSELHHNYLFMHPDATYAGENYRSQDVTFAHNYANGIARGADMHNPFGFPPFERPPHLDPVERELTVYTKYGPVTGSRIPTGGPGSVVIASFLGLPFAKPPVGKLRFEKPQEPEAWTEPYLANTVRDQCMQSPLFFQLSHPGWNNISEDCLYLNLYSPVDTRKEPYPVMVYIHGGAYQFGGTLMFPGHFLAAKGVVVITLAYRQNIFGYLSTNEPELHSNFGMWDQVIGLRWVKDNVRKFGGDPNKITIFGQSAGASSVGLLSLSPASKDLFHQAIYHSGSDLTVWAINGPETHPETYAYGVAEHVGCGDEATVGNQEMLECLRQVDAEILLTTRPECPACLGFQPVVDGPGGFLPKMPRILRQEGHFNKGPILTGTNTDEGSMFIAAADPTLMFRNMTKNEFEIVLDFVIKDLLGFMIVTGEKEAAAEAARWYYLPWPLINNSDRLKVAVAQTITDAGFVAPENELVDYALHRGMDVYQYQFGVGFNGRVGPPQIGPIPPISIDVPEWIGATHGWDSMYVWGYPMIPDAPKELQEDTENLGSPFFHPNQVDKEWNDYFMTLLTNFAKYGNPTPEAVSPPTTDAKVTWDKVTIENRKYLFMQNEVAEQRENLRSHEASFWNNYINWMTRDGNLHHPWQWDGPREDQRSKTEASDVKMSPAENYFDFTKIMQAIIKDPELFDQLKSDSIETIMKDTKHQTHQSSMYPKLKFNTEIDPEILKIALAELVKENIELNVK